MLHMKGLIVASLLLTAICTAQTKSQCSVLMKIDSVMYADTKDETVDSVTVCDDGKATAFHRFTAPALGGAPPQPTTWDYSQEIGREAVSDIQRIVGRKDIAELNEHLKIVKTGSALDVVMHFQIVDRGKKRTITLQAPLLACTDEDSELPKGVLDLMCVFDDLYERAKTGISPENGCDCKSLHEIAVSPQGHPSR
jgi:hypothetical protein